MSIQVTNAGPGRRHAARAADRMVPQHLVLGRRRPQAGAGRHRRSAVGDPPPVPRASWSCSAAPDRAATDPTLLFCDNETNDAATVRPAPAPRIPRTGSTITWSRRGADRQPGAARHQVRLLVPADRRTRARPSSCACVSGPRVQRQRRRGRPGRDFEQGHGRRRAEADEFYAELTPDAASADEAMVMRQAFAGMLWSKQLYYYDVRALARRRPDATCARPRPGSSGRNARWRNFDAFDIMSMPDKWEYPWFAAWDLAFHCVALAHVDPGFAKYQLILLCREWFQHPERGPARLRMGLRRRQPPGAGLGGAGGASPSTEGSDIDFLSRVFDKLLVNFTWWVNLEDNDGQQRVRGRLPRPGQHRAHRPVAPAGRGRAGAVRRHRVDGGVRPGHGRHRRCTEPQRAAPGHRPDREVRRALRRHPRRRWRPRACGTTPTACSTTVWSPRTGP